MHRKTSRQSAAKRVKPRQNASKCVNLDHHKTTTSEAQVCINIGPRRASSEQQTTKKKSTYITEENKQKTNE